MSYTSGINQRFRGQTLYSNYTAENVPITDTSNLGLIANLKYVQEWMSSVLANYMTILNPIFSGSMTSSAGGNIAVSSLTVPTITSNTNFLISPTIQAQPIDLTYTGEIFTSVSNIPPPNTLLCDGRSLSSLQYQKLYSLIGTTYGGSGGTFNLPNFSSYFPIGGNSTIGGVASSDFSGGSQAVSSNFGGSSGSSPPIFYQVPPHTHNISDPGHFHYLNDLEENMVYGEVPGIGTILYTPFSIITIYSSTNIITTPSATGVSVISTGENITETDPTSGLHGANISLPYTAVFYYIAI